MPDDIDATIDKLHAAGATDDEISAIIKEKYGHPSDSGAIALAAIGKGIPVAARGAAAIGADASKIVPRIPGMAATFGRVVGGLGAPLLGAYEHGPIGALAGVAAADRVSDAGAKTGAFFGRLMQKAGSPVARGLEAAAPAARILTQLSGASGVGDLAQMAEPNRRDIGFLGMGPSVDVPGAEPPVINALLARIRGYLRAKSGH